MMTPDTILVGCEYRFRYIDDGKEKFTTWKTVMPNYAIAKCTFSQLSGSWVENAEWHLPRKEKK